MEVYASLNLLITYLVEDRHLNHHPAFARRLNKDCKISSE